MHFTITLPAIFFFMRVKNERLTSVIGTDAFIVTDLKSIENSRNVIMMLAAFFFFKFSSMLEHE